MVLVRPMPPALATTKECEDDELSYRGVNPRDVDLIRNSPEWKLLLDVLRSWRDPPNTSERSCLLPEHDGQRVSAHGTQIGPPIHHDFEVIVKAKLELFGRGSNGCERRVLRARCAPTSRLFTVELTCPNNHLVPSRGVHREVVCSLDGQPNGCAMFYRRLVYTGPQMVDPGGFTHVYHTMDPISKRVITHKTTRDGKYHDAVPGWHAEKHEGRAGQIDEATKAFDPNVTSRTSEVPPPSMLRIRKYQGPR